MEQIGYDLSFRWFAGLKMDAAWHPPVPTHDRDRLLRRMWPAPSRRGSWGCGRASGCVGRPLLRRRRRASLKSVRPEDGSGEPPGPGRNGERDVPREKRPSETHASTTGPDAGSYRKGNGREGRLCFLGHALMENRHGLVVDAGPLPAPPARPSAKRR